MKDYSGQWFFHLCEFRTPLRSQKPGTFSLRNVCTHTHTCASGLGASWPPRAYIRRLLEAPLALRLLSPYSIKHRPYLWWGNWGLTRLWRHEAELRDLYPDSLFRAFWLLERPCLALGRFCVITSFPSAWADMVDDHRLWAGTESVVNLALSTTPYTLYASRQHSFSLRLSFFILQMEIIMRPALQGFEINWRILYWLQFE